MSVTPPHENFDIPVVHAIRKLYKEVYIGSGKVSKRDKLGIYAKIENTLIECLSLLIEAAYKTRSEKKIVLESARIKIEISKQLIRTAHEIGAVSEDQYLRWQLSLQEISKMTNGWIKYLETKNPPR
ncbi:MAG TPA: four helix bundle protein [Candidatus Paceibacterota bacterium]|nr:four helix bundle protein [Candidatus Paceibacterota bacterium]